MPLRAITFDFWCTLFRDANSAPRQQIRIEALARAANVDLDAADAALGQVWREFDRSHREDQRTLNPEDAVSLAARELGVTFAPAEAESLTEVFATAILIHSPEPIDGALEAVQDAAARGPVGLICDSGVSPGRSLRQLLDRHGFTAYFKAMNFSDELGVSKPQRPMFDTMFQALGVPAGACLHIGDLEYSDIAGAKAAGAQAALFTGDNPRFAEAHSADYVFNAWPAFRAALPGLFGA